MEYNNWVPLIDFTASINTSSRREYRKRYIDNFSLLMKKNSHYMREVNKLILGTIYHILPQMLILMRYDYYRRTSWYRCLYVSTCGVNPCGCCKISELCRSRDLFKLDFSKFFQENDCNRAEITKCINSKWDNYGRWGSAVLARTIMATFEFS